MTWRRRGLKKGSTDPTVYTGVMGTALTCLRSYEATGNDGDLRLCADIVHDCVAAAHPSTRCNLFLLMVLELTLSSLGILSVYALHCVFCMFAITEYTESRISELSCELEISNGESCRLIVIEFVIQEY